MKKIIFYLIIVFIGIHFFTLFDIFYKTKITDDIVEESDTTNLLDKHQFIIEYLFMKGTGTFKEINSKKENSPYGVVSYKLPANVSITNRFFNGGYNEVTIKIGEKVFHRLSRHESLRNFNKE